ncbi:phosphomannomutase [Actinopolyspora lacussalsi subsp. righensis]|uniref:Phosphomannomutase n=1 Tax=Actinopolyspora righensis TaxID=995060 RepID=A0A1I6YCE6_9ACTN|nr:phospho-sugar mutase [Actinopolyspora righensis]SFT48058.1 phosphomannomutase [Actinopolyspora righensis]
MSREQRVLEAAREWLAGEVDEADHAELSELTRRAANGDSDAASDLADRVAGSPAFGTAGIRAPLRAGPNGMNRAVVIRTTAGLAGWLRRRGTVGTVVVGHDARHGSRRFAVDAADVLCAAGFEVRVLPEPLPTPVLARATRALGAVAGVQLTASHNPPTDNGYKVYLAGGDPLVAPYDAEIEGAVSEVGAADTVPREHGWHHYERALPEYLERVAELVGDGAGGLRVAVTALHGVGAEPLERALRSAGFTDTHFVTAQREPDPDFPTVEFPNPEEPGATDAVLELARDVDADLAVALDPDADRCALGVPTREGGWRMLRGDETGVLLGEHILSTIDRVVNPDPLVATTIVSSAMLESVARAHGARYDETLTGFKWLIRAGDGSGGGLVYAYEEALGHCVDPDHVRDKDGIATAVLACELAATLARDGTTLSERLAELEIEHGVHETEQITVRMTDPGTRAETMRLLRRNPPTELAGTPVETRDLLPEADVLILRDAGDAETGRPRVVIRPSGTEPKLKCYLQTVVPVEGPDRVSGLTAARGRARELLASLSSEVRSLVDF